MENAQHLFCFCSVSITAYIGVSITVSIGVSVLPLLLRFCWAWNTSTASIGISVELEILILLPVQFYRCLYYCSVVVTVVLWWWPWQASENGLIVWGAVSTTVAVSVQYCIELDWIGLDWIGLDWIGLDWIGLNLRVKKWKRKRRSDTIESGKETGMKKEWQAKATASIGRAIVDWLCVCSGHLKAAKMRPIIEKMRIGTPFLVGNNRQQQPPTSRPTNVAVAHEHDVYAGRANMEQRKHEMRMLRRRQAEETKRDTAESARQSSTMGFSLGGGVAREKTKGEGRRTMKKRQMKKEWHDTTRHGETEGKHCFICVGFSWTHGHGHGHIEALERGSLMTRD